MSSELNHSHPQTVIGIECGGTRTVAILVDAADRIIDRFQGGAANLRLVNDTQLLAHFKAISRKMPKPDAVGIGMAGARTDADLKRIRNAAARVWPKVPCFAANDLETALAVGGPANCPRVLVLSGTGSCSYGCSPAAKTVRVGGWGHILGDRGSSYDISLQALREVIRHYDQTGKWSRLGQDFLIALQLNSPNELIAWIQNATKTDVASLAVPVFSAFQSDPIAKKVLIQAAQSLAEDAVACARQLALKGAPVEFLFAGSALLKQPEFSKLTARKISAAWSEAKIFPLPRASVWGAVLLARQFLSISTCGGERPNRSRSPVVGSSAVSPTERRNPRSMRLDRLGLKPAIQLMLSEDAKIPAALLAEEKTIESALRLIVSSLRRGGRLIYVGAGTSGRLGVLDASECPPTFRTPPTMVQAIIAGGQTAIWQAIEGAEDDAAGGADAVRLRGVSRRDVVVGIAASGRTPFVWGALAESKKRGAKTVMVCFNPYVVIPKQIRPNVLIAADLGPEILTGSTRLKSGTATKLVLNIFSTLAMVQLGKVRSNLMIDLNPSNVKLRGRAVNIVRELTGASERGALLELEKSGWVVQTVIQKLQR
jgi:N-acetylmuramic acid 6-phosphate etherase